MKDLFLFNLSIFVERLNEYYNDKELTITAFARELHFSRATVSGLLNGTHTPSTAIIIALVQYFNCSADYLLGLIDLPKDVNFNCVKPFKETLRKCLTAAKKSEYRLQKDLSLSSSLTYKWLHGNTLPTVPTLINLAKYFGCSIDELLGREG